MIQKMGKNKAKAQRHEPKPVKRARRTMRAKPKPVDPLALVRAVQPTINREAEPQYQFNKTQTWHLDVEGIPGLKPGELEAILEREGVRQSYSSWREAKAVVQPLSTVGGIQSVTLISETVKVTTTRSEMWLNGQCYSMDGGVTKLRRKEDK